MKTRLTLVLCITFIVHASVNSQVKIGDNATTINSASLLELETTNKGFVLPRVSLTSTSSSSPLASGLLTGTIVYNTNSSITGGSGIGIYYWDGSKWNYLANTTITGNYWSITGNSGTTPASNFIGTTDAKDFVAKTNNTERMRIMGAASGSSQAGWVGMGVTLPKSALDVAGNYSGKNVFTIQNTSSTGFSSVDMLDNSGNLAGTFGFANSGTGGIFSGKDYFNIYGNDFVFTNNSGTYAFYVKGSNGYIGLNTNTPSERLHVVGNIYLNGAFMPGGDAGTAGYLLTSAGANTSPTWTNPNNIAWRLTGNSGTSASANFIGTTDNIDFVMRTNNVERFRVTGGGNVGIGLTNPSYKLSVLSSSNPLYLSGLQATSTFTTDSLLTINAGVVKKAPYSSLTGSFWSTTGNSGTSYATNFIGTTDNTSLRFRTNNIEQMLLDSLGTLQVGYYGASSFNTDNPPKLSVDYSTTTSNTIAYMRGSIDSYLQLNIRNRSNGTNASTDYVATADNGTDSTYYVDLGINSSTYAPGVDNWGGANDAYLYSSSRNLLLGTQASSSDVIFLLGGGRTKYNTVLRLDGSTGNIIVGTGNNQANATGNVIRGPNGGTGTNIPGGSLTLQGGSSNGNTSGGALNLYGGGTVSGTYGAVNINTSTNSATNINTGTSASNITMGGAANNILLPKFSTVGGMYYTSVNTGQISTTGSNMTWDSINNRLGIGITNPGYKLSVLSSSNPLYLSGVQATSTFSSDSILTINAGIVKKAPYSSLTGNYWNLTGNSGTTAGTNFIGTTDATDFVAKTNNTERLRITSSGNIGIGTNSPQQSLSVNNGANIDQGNGNTGSTVNALTFGSNSGEAIGSKRSSGGNQYGLDFYTSYNNRMVITNGGNVGIGTTNPSYRLSVLSSSDPLYLSGVQATSTFSSDSILTIYNGVVKKTPYSSLPSGGSSGWSLMGNSGTSTATNFLGTIDNTGLIFKVNNTQAGYLGNSSSQATTFGYNTSGTSTSQYGTAIGATAQATSQYTSALGYGSSASGQYSAALGYNASANSQYANAIGSGSSASNQYATAVGYNSSATSLSSVALGYNASATSQDAVAAGNGSSASTSQSIAIGRQATASGYQAIAVGYNASAATNSTTLAIGVSSAATGYQATAIGYSTVASNSQSLSIGNDATASGSQSTAIGNGASASGTNSTAIGNGASTSQSNALILGNTSANVGIGTSTPNTGAGLDVNAKFKLGDIGTVNKNVVSFSSTLSSTSLPGGTGSGTLFGFSFTATSTDVTITIPSSANYLTSTKATVTVSPGFDLPTGVSIASARMTSTSQLKVRLVNATTTDYTISGTVYITINEF